MKLAILILAVVAAASAQFNPGQYTGGQYKPFQSQYPSYFKPKYTTYRPAVYSTPAPLPYVPSTIAPISIASKVYNPDARAAAILKYGNEINPDGSYNFFYETENGIAAQEQGATRNLGGNPPSSPIVAQGGFSYTGPDGIVYTTSYVADENGYQPKGDHLPVAPEIPPQIARALAYIAANPQKLSK